MAPLTVIPGSRGTAAAVDEPDWVLLIPGTPDGGESNASAWRESAARDWKMVASEMAEAGTLSPANRHQLQRLVLAYLRYDIAAGRLFAEQAVIGSPKTNVPMLNLWQVEMRAADSDATSAEMELGITPRRRGSVAKVKARAKQPGAVDGYLAAVSKKT